MREVGDAHLVHNESDPHAAPRCDDEEPADYATRNQRRHRDRPWHTCFGSGRFVLGYSPLFV